MALLIIGIDCATNPRDVGVAVGHFRGGLIQVETLARGDSKRDLARDVSNHLPADEPALLALDAPLGWPNPLAPILRDHEAGAPIATAANQLFRRETDRAVRRLLGQQSLDVGADRIARTAHAALKLLQEVRDTSGMSIPLAWHPKVNATSAIEVYPAATLRAHGIRHSGYKKKDQAAERLEVLRAVGVRLSLPEDRSIAEEDDDVLDATVCLLAAQDFLQGKAVPPDDLKLARREGWIWVRRPTDEGLSQGSPRA